MTTQQNSGYRYQAGLWGAIRDAVRYWEPNRLRYNAVLAVVSLVAMAVAFLFGPEWTSFSNWQLYLVFAALANLCYSAAYLLDLPLQFSPFCGTWRQRRKYLFVAGTGLAAVLAFGFSFFIVAPLVPD